MNTVRNLEAIWLIFLSAITLIPPAVHAQENAELAMTLQNPVAALISVPFQLNYDRNIGPGDDGDRWTLNIQPVIPVGISQEWNLITRVIVPVVWQSDIYPGAGSQSGIGDVVASAFFSPKTPTSGGWIWGAGPVFLLPAGSDDLLTMDKWGTGPTAVLLKQTGPWTYGALVNHVWSFAGGDDSADISATFLQPFLSYTTPAALSFIVNSESTYDWKNETWSAPVNAVISKVASVGSRTMSFSAGVRYWVDSPGGGPEGLGFRLVAVLLIPR